MTLKQTCFLVTLILTNVIVVFGLICEFYHPSNSRVSTKVVSVQSQLHCLACVVQNEKYRGMNHQKKRIFFIRDNDSETSIDNDQEVEENTEDNVTDTVATKAMVNTIGFYKSYISPLLPPACRFTPTCSQYGIQAIEEYGPQKGLILIAWRLLRCSPIGGRGYDPPKWPPVSYTYSSY